MTKLFYLSEIVKFAIEKERESTNLYKALSDKADNKDIKNLFHELMLEEEKHEKFYTVLLSTVSKEQTPGVQEDEEYDAYMKELIRASRSVSVEMTLDYAISREKDSILFYVGLKNYLPSIRDKEKIDCIIKEESKHMSKLLELK